MTIDMSQFYQVFFDESGEHLAEMERLLLEMDVDTPDMEEMNAIFRAAHSIKGGSGTFGFTDMTDVTHVLENLLDRLRKGEMAPRAEMIDVFLQATDVLKAQLAGHIKGAPSDPESALAVCEKLRALTANQVPASPLAAPQTPALTPAVTAPQSATTTFEIVFRPGKSFLKRKNAGQELIAELSRLGSLQILAQPEIEVDEKIGKGKKDKRAAKDKKNKSSKRPDNPVEWHFRLTTEATLDALEDIFAFIAEPGETDIRRIDAEPTAADEDPGYGFFSDPAPPSPQQEDLGYGFFEPSSPPTAESAPVAPPSPVMVERRANPAAAAPAAPAESSSIRVGVEKVDQLINLVGELVITQAMLAQTASTVDPVLYEALQNGLTQLERNTRDMQESVMSIRMLPISFVFSRFPRVVRDLAGKLNKQVELVTVGESTELDKGLIERIADPLTHLVRNSLDHGIETPEKRIAAGKNPKGTITLSASHQGGAIVIEVADDGAGLNREKILSKAAERGLDASESMSDQEVWQLIFAPGFSTADIVTDVSGRGVGMDVVIRNITEMGGNVEIDSATGFGTKITVRLPLTLAILDGMSVALGDSTYVVPMGMIVETFQPKPEDVKAVTGQGEVVHIRGEYLPLLALHKIFNMEPKFRDPTQGVLVMIEDKGKRAALFVDALVGQQQVVIKSLESNYRKVSGVSGATIMGDGKVAMILDVAALIKSGQSGF